jgi:hypothetical protein
VNCFSSNSSIIGGSCNIVKNESCNTSIIGGCCNIINDYSTNYNI